MSACPRCGEANSERARFCDACGAPLAAEIPAQHRRRTVTIVFADLVGSTALGERLDAETLREILDRYFEAMRQALQRHGGTVEKYIGDAVMSVFGLAVLHEDDALRAARAAFEMRDELTRLNRSLAHEFGVTLANRIGVNTGEVVAGDAAADQRLATGDAVNVAARLEQSADAGDILLGQTTLDIVRDYVRAERLESLELKGKTDRIDAYRLLSVHPEPASMPSPARAAMVGRAEQLAQLERALAGVVASSQAALAMIVGEPGVGKSRLAAEFCGRSDDARLLRGRCLSYGQGITFWPVREILRTGAGVADHDDDVAVRAKVASIAGDQRTVGPIAAVLTGSTDYPIEETIPAVRRFLEAFARPCPVVVLVEDVHWAEAGLIDLLEHVATRARGAVLILCSARPEIRESTLPGVAHVVVDLQPLDEADCGRLLSSLIEGAPLDPRLRNRILDAAGGNPLFIEQMVSMLADEGVLTRGDGQPLIATETGDVAVPATISALLDARIDRLAPGPRATLERAAVIGKVFYRNGIVSVTSPDLRPRVDADLRRLVERGFIQTTTSDLEGEEAFAFRHGLIRDAAYRGMLKRTRAELHEGFADWLERRVVGVPGVAEILGFHLERSYRLRADLGPDDEHAASLAARAAEVLGRAGHGAAARGDVTAASGLLERAAGLMPDGPQRSMVRLVSIEQLHEAGRVEDARRALNETVHWPATRSDPLLASRARIADLTMRLFEGELEYKGARRQIEVLLPSLDEAGRARAEMLLGLIEFDEGRNATAQAAFERALDIGRRIGDESLVARALDWIPLSIAYGPTPVDEGIKRCEEVLGLSRPGSRVEASVLSSIGYLEALRGRCEEARSLEQRSRAISEDLGMIPDMAASSQAAAGIELRCGDPSIVLARLEADRDLLERLGEQAYLATTCTRLSQVRYALNDLDGADEAARMALDLLQDVGVAGLTLVNSVRARVLARRGRIAEAESMARSLTKVTRHIDAHERVVDVLMAVAEILCVAGRGSEAMPFIEEVKHRCEVKGDRATLERFIEVLQRGWSPPASGGRTSC